MMEHCGARPPGGPPHRQTQPGVCVLFWVSGVKLTVVGRGNVQTTGRTRRSCGWWVITVHAVNVGYPSRCWP